MAQHTSRVDQRADRSLATDDAHEDYRSDGRPMLHSSPRGKVLRKSIYRYTVTCPECDVFAIYDDGAKPVCPECGIICTGKDEGRTDFPGPVIIDAKAAGRISGD